MITSLAVASSMCLGADDLDQLVRGQVGQVVQRLHVLLAERHQHRRRQHLDRRDVVAHAQLDALLGQLGVAAGDERLGAADQFLGDRFVEALDRGDLILAA